MPDSTLADRDLSRVRCAMRIPVSLPHRRHVDAWRRPGNRALEDLPALRVQRSAPPADIDIRSEAPSAPPRR